MIPTPDRLTNGSPDSSVRESAERRLISREDVLQILNERRARSIHRLTYTQLSSEPVQFIEWKAFADMPATSPEDVSHAFDFSSAECVNAYDQRIRRVPRIPEKDAVITVSPYKKRASVKFRIPLLFDSDRVARLQFQYETIDAYSLESTSEYHSVTIMPQTVEALSVRIEGKNGLSIQVPSGGKIGDVGVSRIESDEKPMMYDEALSLDAAARLEVFPYAICYRIPNPRGGHNYRFGFQVLPASLLNPAPDLAWKAFQRDLPELLLHRKSQPNERWVAYHLEKRFQISTSRLALMRLRDQQKIPTEEFFIYGIEPALLNDAGQRIR